MVPVQFLVLVPVHHVCLGNDLYLRTWQKARLVEKQKKAENGESDSEESDFEEEEVDGDFKVPAKVWTKLYQ